MISDSVKELEENYDKLEKLVFEQAAEIEHLKRKAKEYRKCCETVLPAKVHTHKARRNTTVVFKDGSSMTVKRKVGEKDCIETAIAYCILKQMLTAKDVKELIKNREEH